MRTQILFLLIVFTYFPLYPWNLTVTNQGPEAVNITGSSTQAGCRYSINNLLPGHTAMGSWSGSGCLAPCFKAVTVTSAATGTTLASEDYGSACKSASLDVCSNLAFPPTAPNSWTIKNAGECPPLGPIYTTSPYNTYTLTRYCINTIAGTTTVVLATNPTTGSLLAAQYAGQIYVVQGNPTYPGIAYGGSCTGSIVNYTLTNTSAKPQSIMVMFSSPCIFVGTPDPTRQGIYDMQALSGPC